MQKVRFVWGPLTKSNFTEQKDKGAGYLPGKQSGDLTKDSNNNKPLHLGVEERFSYSRYRGDPEVGIYTRMVILNQIYKRRRNCLKSKSNFPATPEAVRDESSDVQLEQFKETTAFLTLSTKI